MDTRAEIKSHARLYFCCCCLWGISTDDKLSSSPLSLCLPVCGWISCAMLLVRSMSLSLACHQFISHNEFLIKCHLLAACHPSRRWKSRWRRKVYSATLHLWSDWTSSRAGSETEYFESRILEIIVIKLRLRSGGGNSSSLFVEGGNKQCKVFSFFISLRWLCSLSVSYQLAQSRINGYSVLYIN